MKKIFIFSMVFLCVVSMAFGVNFKPTVMTLSASPQITYDFNSTLNIPVTVTGTPASVIFQVFTNGKAASINKVTSGYLGWHFVNQIDTCLFTSGAMPFVKGSNNVAWNGKDEDGKAVPKGNYTYYLFGYDDVTPKTVATRTIGFGWCENSIIITRNEAGVALVQPLIYSGGRKTSNSSGASTHTKWALGGDPDDGTLVETTASGVCLADNAPIALLPTDHSMWFKCSQQDGVNLQVVKYKWVPNGTSVVQTAWGDEGMFVYAQAGSNPELHTGIATMPGTPYLYALNGNFFLQDMVTDLIYVDLDDGSQVKKVDMSDWWYNLEQGELKGQYCGGPADVRDTGSGTLRFSFHGSCMQHLIDPMREGDINDMTLWVNRNGDYVADHNFGSDAGLKWVCNDYNVAPYIYNVATDAMGFNIIPTFDLGSVSFGLMGPDGTGINNFAYSGETAGQKYGNHFVDYGSAYDGMYTSNVSASTDTGGWWYVAHDSIKGVISDKVGVADAPAAFAVAQNVPNPFNPSTTITFSLAKAGKVTVDVFNVAGQKVATLANGAMNAGSHSVTWNASKLSAGVYSTR